MLCGAGVTNDDVVAVLHTLDGNSSLARLDLRGNKVSDAAFVNKATLDEKAMFCANAGACAVIIINDFDEKFQAGGRDSTLKIPVLVVNAATGTA